MRTMGGFWVRFRAAFARLSRFFAALVLASAGRASEPAIDLPGWCRNPAAFAAAELGEPSAPFFAEAGKFPRKPWPASLRTSFEESSERPLSDYLDAILYLGPEKDRHLKGALPLSEAQQRELERRGAIKYADPQAAMRARSQGRSRWFESHPNDIVPRPETESR